MFESSEKRNKERLLIQEKTVNSEVIYEDFSGTVYFLQPKSATCVKIRIRNCSFH